MVADTALAQILDIDFFTRSISAAALFMILFMTRNVMAQSVRERIPEFAVLKTIGFPDRRIFALVLSEAAVLCLVGAFLALILAQSTPAMMRRALPPMQNVLLPVITPGVIAAVLACAMLIALASGLPAAWRLKRQSIADALGGR